MCIVVTNGLSLNHATPPEETVERTNEPITQYNGPASTPTLMFDEIVTFSDLNRFLAFWDFPPRPDMKRNSYIPSKT